MRKLFVLLALSFYLIACEQEGKINRKEVVDRHKIITTKTDSISPAQVGNGKFAFGMDITGLQTFVPFNTMSDWGWHSFPLPEGISTEDYIQPTVNTHGREIPYCLPNPQQPELSKWLAGNPHRINLGRIGFVLLKNNQDTAKESDLSDTQQTIDLWTGIVNSEFSLEGEKVSVETVCDSDNDIVGVNIKSSLLEKNRLFVFFEFPYAESGERGHYIGTYENKESHSSILEENSQSSVSIIREMDNFTYTADIN